jgi:hypothetical protein
MGMNDGKKYYSNALAQKEDRLKEGKRINEEELAKENSNAALFLLHCFDTHVSRRTKG